MSSLTSSTIPEEPSIQDRLSAVKKALEKATLETLPQHPSSTADTSSPENNDPNASFHLGMELFGQEPSVVEQNVREKLTELERELDEVLEMDPPDKEAVALPENSNEEDCSLQSSPQELEQQAQKLRNEIVFLRECSKARSLLDESIVLSSPAPLSNTEPDLREACQRLVQARQALDQATQLIKEQQSENEQRLALQIVDSIQATLRRQKVDLLGRTKALWHACVVLCPDSLAVRGESVGSNQLSVVYDVLETLSDDGTTALQDVLHKFAQTLYHTVFAPLLTSYDSSKVSEWTFHETQDREHSLSKIGATSLSTTTTTSTKVKGPVRRLEWSRNEQGDILAGHDNTTTKTTESPMAAWKETIAFIQRIVVFVADHVCLQRESLCELVGKRLFGKPGALPNALNLDALGLDSCRIGNDNGLLMDPLVNTMQDTCVPTRLSVGEMERLDSLANELRGFVDPFLDELVVKHLVSGEKKNDTRLAVFCSSFGQAYVDHRRCLILNQARDLLLQNDYHNTVQVGVDVKDDPLGLNDGMAVFTLHKSCISDSAAQLVALCRRTMDEAVEQPADVPVDSPLALLPATLYRTAREVLDLYRAIIPVTYGNEVSNVPRTAAILHNDCVFFAHHCLTLGLEYKDKFPTAATGTLAEPPLQDARGNLLRQTCIFVDMVPLFRELADRSMRNMLDLQANQLADIVGQRITLLNRALRSNEILAEWSDAETALTAGLYHLTHLSQAWKPVLSRDILNRSMCYLADVIFTLYLDQVTKATDISASASNFVSTLFHKATHDIGALVNGDKSGSRVWERFDAVGRFMDMSLADVEVALGDGVFCSVTGPELTRLILAAFDNTPKRAGILKLLASS